MTTLFLLLILSTAIASPLAAAPYVEMDTFISSEPIALEAISDDWKGRYSPNGEKQTASVWLESGYKKNNWSIGALYREEQQFTFSSDTADLFYTISNDQDLDQNRAYKIDLDAYRFRGFGARIAKHFKPTSTLELSLGTSLFSASNLLDGQVSGVATAEDGDNYNFQLDGDYVYDEDVLFNRPNTNAPSGIGVAVDLSVKWKPNQNTKVDLRVKDLAGAIRWRDVPYTEAQANSETNTTTEDGFSSINPILSGIEGYKPDYTQKLKPSADLHAQYQFKNTAYTAGAKAKYINESRLFAVGAAKQTNKGKLALYYWPDISTLEAAFQGKKLGLSFAIDSLDSSEVKTLWLSLQYQ
ncbi:DUF5723 family protein [Leucothrix arctica]|uniref:DUF5723 domain-containing protein n=1 Tax=Leucothrix arctica TaxID=1481894 RepID=A0A317CH11_9GAMM|nr:DUF5723 family protein [Leucothrix arctica]PWQ95542.1 hypothetical protein DKT75_12220 [Leucothrix arctica]